VIRTAAAADVPALVEYAIASVRENPGVHPGRPASYFTAAHWRKHVRVLEENRLHDRGVVLYLFTRERKPRLAGNVTIANVVRGAFQAAYIGYALRKSFEGRGLMTEALRAIVRYAFGTLRLHRLMANHMPSNRRSAKVLRRLGFRREGLAKDYLLIAGRWRPHVLTSLVNPRWKPLSGDAAARAAIAPPAGARRAPRRRRPKGR
jgi:ribosomal-protein-alanine N-acetyltransferase